MEGGKACRSAQGVMQHIVDLGGAELKEMLAQLDGQAEKAKADHRAEHLTPVAAILRQQSCQKQSGRIKEERIHQAAAEHLRLLTGK